MILNAPGKRPPMYSDSLFEFFSRGLGPLRLGFELRPLPLATRIRSARADIRTLVGYQPTGMNPSDRLCPRRETSITARLLTSALATHRVLPLGAIARLLGVLPCGAWG